MWFNNPGFLFVHVPKTGGTSFRLSLEAKVDAERIFYDYGSRSSVTSPLIMDLIYEKQDVHKFFEIFCSFERPCFLIGHNVARYYPFFKASNIISFMREPVQQVISHFEHHSRNYGYSGTLADFCSKASFANNQKKALGGVAYDLIGCVGLTERYSESLLLMKDIIGIECEDMTLNENPDKKERKYEIDDELKQLISSSNREDIRIYNEARRIFDCKMSMYKKGLSFVCGRYSIDENHRIKGWSFYADSDETVELDFLIDGCFHSRHMANAYRHQLKEKNVHRNGYVGFQFELDKSIVIEKCLLECVVSKTGQRILMF